MKHNKMFDIVFPVGPKDYEIIKYVVQYAQRSVIGYRNVYLIAKDELSIPGTIFVNESVFPFQIDDVKSLHGDTQQSGWYLQQLLKLYAGQIIPNICNKYLVIDADTFFLKPVSFLENDIVLCNTSIFDHVAYSEHMARLHPDLVKQNKNVSGISHHMMFDNQLVLELMNMVETYHNKNNDDQNFKPFWKLFLEAVDVDQRDKPGASEYEIYFHFVQRFHPESMKIRNLRWKDEGHLQDSLHYDYISVHWYCRSPLNPNRQ